MERALPQEKSCGFKAVQRKVARGSVSTPAWQGGQARPGGACGRARAKVFHRPGRRSS